VAWLYDHVRQREERRSPAPPSFTAPEARRLLRATAAARAVGVVAALVLVLAVGWPGPWPPGTVVVAAVVLVVALGVGTFAVLRLGAIERGGGRR
jgi:hypothetical protein